MTGLACLAVLLSGLLAGCGFPTNFFFSTPVPPEDYIQPVIPTVTPYLGPTYTPVIDTATPPPCAYVWTTTDLPEETAMVREALKQAGLSDVQASVNSYGENCLDTANNKVISFSALESDFYFTLTVKDASDAIEMGNWVDKVLDVVDQFQPGKVPGSSLGKAGFTFHDGRNESFLSFSLADAKKARTQGMRGADLYRALMSK